MKITGADHIPRVDLTGHLDAKMVFNDVGAIIFSARSQHSDTKAPGISYEHDAKGNALAAMLQPGMIEVRFDPRFSDDRVTGILRKLLACPEVAEMKGWKVTYQGRAITLDDRTLRSAHPHPTSPL